MNPLTLNRWVIAAFALASGLYKLFGGAADVELFGRVGLSPGMTAAFGGVQALCGVALFPRPSRRLGSLLLAVCNAFASYALFVSGVQPFGWISLLFVAMALLAGRDKK